jgi:hypothetical protein
MASESDTPQAIDPCGLHARESQRLQPDRTPQPHATPSEGTSHERCTLTDALRSSGEAGDLLCLHAAEEIERLRLAIRRLAEQDATLSICGGTVIVEMDATLTDAEREAIQVCIEDIRFEDVQATLRGLLKRTGPIPSGNDSPKTHR